MKALLSRPIIGSLLTATLLVANLACNDTSPPVDLNPSPTPSVSASPAPSPSPSASPQATQVKLNGSAALTAGQCSSSLTAGVYDAQGNPISGAARTVALTGAATLAFYSNSGCTSAISSLSIASSSSAATFYVKATAAGSSSITATSSGLTTAHLAATVSAAAASKLAFIGQPSQTQVSSAISPPVTVGIYDAYGNLTSSSASVSVALTGGSGALSGTVSVAAVAGTATFSTLQVSATGTTYALTASSSGLTGATSSTFAIVPQGQQNGTPIALTAAWANDGGDKVTRDELRVSGSGKNVTNSVWDGTTVNLWGAKNEVLGFNLVLEAKTTAATNVSVSFQTLTGPGGATISSIATTGNGVFDWTQRNIELFYVRYLQINGLSMLSYNPSYDERHVPARLRRPWTGAGVGTGGWTDRPDHNKFYPDIAVPLELVPTFTVAAGQNQSVWGDIYVPKTATAGTYTGTITVKEGTNISYQIPVSLVVHAFALPDVPTAKTMVNLGYTDIALRYTGTAWPNANTSQDTLTQLVRDRHFQIAHRHKISLIDGDPSASASPGDQPHTEWMSRLNGSLFTAANGYAGPGTGVGNGVYSIGTYGSWTWQNQGESGMWTHADNWVNWFNANASTVDYFLYLIDESTNFTQTEQWASWIKADPGVGKALKSFATINLPDAVSQVPDLDIATSWFAVADTTSWQSAADAINAQAGKHVDLYNGKRPAEGSFATEDDGVALRELAWGQYKKGIDRWMFWESTYYNDYQGGRGQTDVFSNAQTFGGPPSADASYGMTGWNYSNGDGLLFYPGTDTVYPTESYGLQGPLASIRLKLWRRGIQDVDYLAMAAAINPTKTAQIVQSMVPKVLWEVGVADLSDPTWQKTDISWPTDPNTWEAARAQLASIIETGN